MARIVLSDSSPLIGLERVHGLIWLRDLFGQVEITRSVHQELTQGETPGQTLSSAIDAGWIVARGSDPEGPARPPHLGNGEWSTILAAKSCKQPCLALIDDRLARREARAAGIQIAGVASVIGMAYTRGMIASAREVFERLLKSDSRISREVIRAILERVGE